MFILLNCVNIINIISFCSFIQLDVGLLKVTNEITWHGFPEKDPSAVHLDVLHAEVYCLCLCSVSTLSIKLWLKLC